MSSTQAMCTSFKSEIMNGIHALGTTVIRAATTADTFKAALYLDAAALTASTTAYSATNENTGTGYTAGGVTCSGGWIAPSTSGTTAFTTLSAAVTYSSITTSASVSAILIYNSTQSNKAVAVYTFTAQTITAGTLQLTMPTNDASTGLLRIA